MTLTKSQKARRAAARVNKNKAPKLGRAKRTQRVVVTKQQRIKNPTFERTIPMEAAAYMRESVRNGRVVVNGRSIVTQLSDAAASVAYATLYNSPIAPRAIGNTRLELLSRLYERYHFTRFNIDFVTGCSDSDRGRLLLSYDNDPSDPTPPPSLAGYQTLCENSVSKEFSIKRNCSISFKPARTENGLYTNASVDGDERLYDQGQIYVSAASAIAADAMANLGSVWIEYEIELWEPQLEQPAEGASIGGSGGQPSGNNFFNAMTAAGSALSKGISFVNTATGDKAISLPQGVFEMFTTMTAANGGADAVFQFGGPVLTPNRPGVAPVVKQKLYNAGLRQTSGTLNVPAGGLWELIVPYGGALLTQILGSTLAAGTAFTITNANTKINQVNKPFIY